MSAHFCLLTPIVHECNTVQKKMTLKSQMSELPTSTKMHQSGKFFQLQYAMSLYKKKTEPGVDYLKQLSSQVSTETTTKLLEK